jgi:hypothetical protein
MKYEWRIFYSDINYKPWVSTHHDFNELETQFKEAKFEDRPDYYLDVNDEESGLKERWEKDKNTGEKSPKLELKVRQEQSDGFEHWEKCMSIQFKEMTDEDKGLDIEKVKNYMQTELVNPDPAKPMSEKSKIKMEAIIKLLGNELPRRVKIEKQRKQIRALYNNEENAWNFFLEKSDAPDTIVIEETKIKVFKDKTDEPAGFLTICVEGNKIEPIEKFVNEFVHRGDGVIRGYPGFVMGL